jgi:hypothetical protein
MSARGFGSVVWAGAVAGAALGFYLVSLRVASERAALEDVESNIAMTQRDIRTLRTEIGTRGRLAQLERWNVKFIRLAAPSADQFVDGGFQLATLVTPQRKPTIGAPVVLASAPVQSSDSQRRLTGDDEQASSVPPPSRPASDMMHVASYSMPERPSPVPPKPMVATGKAAVGSMQKVTPTQPATKPVKTATADPLAALPVGKPKAKGDGRSAPAGTSKSKITRDTGSE